MARPSIWTHRKFIRLARLLGAPYRAIGALECVWRIGYESGDPRIGMAADVEFAMGWDGEPGRCVNALADAGFLDHDGDCLVIHDLYDHAPEYVRSRRRMEEYRRRRGAGGGAREQTPNGANGTNGQEEALRNGDVTVTVERGGPARDETEQLRNGYVTVTQPLRNCYGSPAPAPAPTPISTTTQQNTETPERGHVRRKRRTVRVSDESFAEWYQLYQRHEARRDAEKAWNSLTQAEREECTRMTPAWFAARPGIEPRFVPLPATFLRQRRWTDDPPPASAPKSVPSYSGADRTPTFYRAEDRREWRQEQEDREHQAELDAIIQRHVESGRCFYPAADQNECQACWERCAPLRARYQTRANCVAQTRGERKGETHA